MRKISINQIFSFTHKLKLNFAAVKNTVSHLSLINSILKNIKNKSVVNLFICRLNISLFMVYLT